MRLIDADGLIAEIKRYNDVEETKPTWRTKDVIALLENCPEPPNPPLTLEELREMDRESVYDKHLDQYGFVDMTAFSRAGGIRYFNSWWSPRCLCSGRFYRRKPEEGTT